MSTGEEFALNLHDRVKRLEEALLPAHLLEEVQAHPAYAPPFGTETAEPPSESAAAEPPSESAAAVDTPAPTPEPPAAAADPWASGPSSSY